MQYGTKVVRIKCYAEFGLTGTVRSLVGLFSIRKERKRVNTTAPAVLRMTGTWRQDPHRVTGCA